MFPPLHSAVQKHCKIMLLYHHFREKSLQRSIIADTWAINEKRTKSQDVGCVTGWRPSKTVLPENKSSTLNRFSGRHRCNCQIYTTAGYRPVCQALCNSFKSKQANEQKQQNRNSSRWHSTRAFRNIKFRFVNEAHSVNTNFVDNRQRINAAFAHSRPADGVQAANEPSFSFPYSSLVPRDEHFVGVTKLRLRKAISSAADTINDTRTSAECWLDWVLAGNLR